MSYKSILVHVETRAEVRTRLAFDLARRHDALLIGLAAARWNPTIVYAAPEIVPITAELVQEGRERAQLELKGAAGQFDKLADGIAARTEWRSIEGSAYGGLSSAAVAADLIVIGPLERTSADEGLTDVNPGDLLVGAGRPVLTVPDGLQKLEAKRIAIGWKNTREARRAVADALPLLKSAEGVVLAQIRESGDETDSINDVQQFLTCHGVRSLIRIAEPAQGTDAELIKLTKEFKADLIVAGAFGRSRLREWIFGGVTQALLKQNAIACLFSH